MDPIAHTVAAPEDSGYSRPGGRLRIIGGRFRGRKIQVPVQAGLRPTSDRVRETLFNWLQPFIPGARCLDLFAGSGALGLEAASRGAGEVVMVERADPVARVLSSNVRRLGAEQVRVQRADALGWLSGDPSPFDIVFLDPPFDAGLLPRTCELLDRNGWLAPRAHVYLEASSNGGLPTSPAGWKLVRDKRAGRVRYGLLVAGDENTDVV